MLGTVPKVLTRTEPSLDLRIAQIGISLDIRLGVAEESCYFFVRHLFIALPWFEQLAESFSKNVS